MSVNLDPKKIAKNLKKPEGLTGIQIGDFMHKGNANFYHQLKNVIDWNPNSNILEIGMGSGKHVEDLIELFPKGNYTGMDYSETMVSESIKNNANNPSHFILGDINNFNLNTSFDVILTINTVYFLDDLSSGISNIANHLKPKGYLIIGKRPKKDLITLKEITQHGFNQYSNQDVIDAANPKTLLFLNEFSFMDEAKKVNDIEVQLHSDFIIFQKK